MTSRTRRYCLLLALALAALARFDRPAAGDDSEEAQRVASLARLTKVIESYSIAADGEKTEPLELLESPVLRYSDTISPVWDGLVFVWTKAGRPEAVMAAHHGTQGRTWLEFRSLSLSPLTGKWKGSVEWAPRTTGVEFTPVEGAPEPDRSAAKRLAQMRSLLKSFSASVSD